VLIGQCGADDLDGRPGNDNLASNQLFGVPVQDGSIDVLDGSAGDFDRCRVPFTVVEDDATAKGPGRTVSGRHQGHGEVD
jgi:hypothetical protein